MLKLSANWIEKLFHKNGRSFTDFGLKCKRAKVYPIKVKKLGNAFSTMNKAPLSNPCATVVKKLTLLGNLSPM